jgi:hypothetical protein
LTHQIGVMNWRTVDLGAKFKKREVNLLGFCT